MADTKDDEVTPPFGIEIDPPMQPWYVVKPNGDFFIVNGPKHEPPVCEPCGRTPAPMLKPDFKGERKCGGCGTTFTPAVGVGNL